MERENKSNEAGKMPHNLGAQQLLPLLFFSH